MMIDLDYWKFFAGLGLFLYGMSRLEDSLKELAGRRFKLFLRKYTTNRLLAIFNGAFASAALQSSSIVLLMVIAFSGAGIISLSNSLGIILGANIGTTFTGWMVSLFGFKTRVEDYVFPLIAMGSLGLFYARRRVILYHWFSFIISFGILFLGLIFMKDGMAQLSSMIDIEQIKNWNLVAFFVFGFALTALIQSSSGMMTITLSALNAQMISLNMAAYIIVGADLGTTITALMASRHGSAVKKRVGIAHFIFNLVSAMLALIILPWLLPKISWGIQDPLFTLVSFHSGFNILGVVLFFPFLGFFEKHLNRLYLNHDERICEHIHKVGVEIPEAAIEALKKDLVIFVKKVFHFNRQIMGFASIESFANFQILKEIFQEERSDQDYKKIKKTEWEILSYLGSLQKEKLEIKESSFITQSMLAIRNGVQSAKSMKDIHHNIHDLSQSAIQLDENFYLFLQSEYGPISTGLLQWLERANWSEAGEVMSTLMQKNEAAYQGVNCWIYQSTQSQLLQGSRVATFLNVNREIYLANRFLLEAIHDISLTNHSLNHEL